VLKTNCAAQKPLPKIAAPTPAATDEGIRRLVAGLHARNTYAISRRFGGISMDDFVVPVATYHGLALGVEH